MPDRLTEIRARLDAATPGPWKRSLSGSRYNPWKVHRGAILVALSGESPEDADLIAHAPADIAWLLAEVEELRAVVRNTPAHYRTDARAVRDGLRYDRV